MSLTFPHQRRLLPSVLGGELDIPTLRQQLAKPYFIPAATQVYNQLQFFRENRQRMGLIVDEYGKIQGPVTLEDIIEEIIGKFTTSSPGANADLNWDAEGAALVDGALSLRQLNRLLDLESPLDGPKTLSGLIVEYLRDIPETDVGLRIANVTMEIVRAQDRRIKIVKRYRPEKPE